MRIETRQSTNRLGLDDDLLDRVFTARGITELAQLEKGLTNLLSPADLPEIDQAALRLADAVEGDEKSSLWVTSMLMGPHRLLYVCWLWVPWAPGM